MNFRHFSALPFVLLFLFTGFPGCSRQEVPKAAERITLAVAPMPASAALYVAEEKGYFKREGLEATLRPYPSGRQAMQAVLAGQAEIATAAETPIARAALEGKPVAVIATLSEVERGVLIVAKKSASISTIDDLRGKNVGVASGTNAEFYLYIHLTTSHIDPKEVRIVNLAPDRVVEALVRGEVDAVSAWPPQTTLLREQLGEDVLILHDPSIYTMTWNAVTTQEFVKHHPERVRNFLLATIKATRFIEERTAEACTIAWKYMGSENPLFGRSWEEVRFRVELTQSLILNMEEEARWMIKREGTRGQAVPNIMEVIYTDGLKAVLPEAVRIEGK